MYINRQDISAGQSPPSHMSPNGNPHMASAAAQQHNTSLLQNFTLPDDLAFSQNQHPQNGGLSFANKQGLQQQSQNDAVRRLSLSHRPLPSQRGQGQMPWIQQPQPRQGPSQPSFNAVPIPRNGLGSIQPTQQQLRPQPGGQNLLALQTNPQANHLNVAGSSFPSQPMSAPPNTASFNVPSAALAQQAQNPMLQMIPPLEKSRFDPAFKSFCSTKQIKIDQRLLSINDRPIDFHMLHSLVMMEGGEIKVQQKDLWSVIGGHMGFVQFPGTTEPSPVIGQQLEHIYRQCLADFDRAYIANMLDLRVRNGLGVSLLNSNEVNAIVSMADQPVSQLRARGLSERIIQFIETHRSDLQRLRRNRGLPLKKKEPILTVPQPTSTPFPVPTSAHTPGPARTPSASMPLNHNTPTPALSPPPSSTPTPRSPKGENAAKAKQTPASAAPKRPLRSLPASSPAMSESPAAFSSIPNRKRPREGDEVVVDAGSVGNNVNVANGPSPPKRGKTDWEIPPSEELNKRAAEINTESLEDATAFFEQMSELFKTSADDAALYTDLSDTFNMILKGCTSETPDGLFGEDVTSRESSPSTGLKDLFEKFIDYSSGQLDHEEGSKAHTPGSSPSTGLAPWLTSITQDSTPALLTASQTTPSPAFTESHDDDGLAILKPFTLFDAFHNSSAQDLGSTCPPDTRDHIIQSIQRWINNPSAERILWFYGAIGGGKSAILQAVAHASTPARVAAVFYFRSHPHCNDGNRLFTTLAWQLAASISTIKNHLSFTLNEDPNLPARDIETQFQELIVRPFLALNEGTSAVQHQGPVVIIAGIDECPDESLQQRILKVIETAVSHISFPLRFLISSTPDTHIEETINHFKMPVLHINLEKPFTESDESYLEILSVGRCSISRDILGRDDPMLMNISRVALEEALCELHPIIKTKPYIDVHHQSFLDFLQDSLRSSQYHVNKRAGLRLYLELMAKLLARHATRLTNHGNDHFTPEFGNLIKHNPQVIELDIQDWEQSLSPLLNALAKLLVPSNMDSLLNRYCQQCQFFQITYDILKYFKSLREEEDPVVEKCLQSLEEIMLYSGPEHQNFDIHFGRIIYGSAAVVGFVMAVLAHQR